MPGSSNTRTQERISRQHKQLLPPPKVYLQEACAKHQFIRHKNASGIYERPERLRAASLGISAAYARLESAFYQTGCAHKGQPFEIVKSAASVDFDHLAVNYVHGADDGAYLQNLSRWAKQSKERIAKGSLEIPDSLKGLEDDLYLCPNSVEAFQGGLGTVCEAIDDVVDASPSDSRRAFVVIRPPGHHCGEDSPNGFCFVNGIAVGAAHAYIDHDLTRVVIFDIDLHHGNGTQEIVSQINQESYRDRLEKNGLRIFYGSIHDISSYPCEEGKVELVADASKSVSGEDGQWLENIHLQPYSAESQFWKDYESRYRGLFARAQDFVLQTGGTGRDDVIVLMSCGFDASEHESPAMNRHGRKVPTGFYHRFTRDACKFAEQYASGRIVSVMEGGYEDRAIVSGAMAHVCGLADSGETELVDPRWWSIPNLQQLEAQTKKRKGRRPRTTHLEPWLQRTLEIHPLLAGLPTHTHRVVVPRLKPPKQLALAPALAPDVSQPRKRGRPRKVPVITPVSSEIASAASKGRKRSHSREDSHSSKQPRHDISSSPRSLAAVPPFVAEAIPMKSHGKQPLVNGYTTSVMNSSSRMSFLAFTHPHGNVTASILVDPTVQLRWQPPSLPLPTRPPHPALPSADGRKYTFAKPVTLPTPPTSDVEMRDEPSSNARRIPPPTLVDLSRHWPKGQIGPGALSAASTTFYKCHTHYEKSLDAWGVRSIKSGMDQHHCYIPNHYKTGLRFLNFRVAQLAAAAEVPFHLPRSSSTPQQRDLLRSLRDLVQQTLLYHHSVREAVFREVRERCYGGRDPSTAKPTGPMCVRLPTLDTWLLHEYVVGATGRGRFDGRRLDAALVEHDPIDLDWRRWMTTSERRLRFGWDEPAPKDRAMLKEAGLPELYSVNEGVPAKPEWLKEMVEKEMRNIREGVTPPLPYDYLPWPPSY